VSKWTSLSARSGRSRSTSTRVAGSEVGDIKGRSRMPTPGRAHRGPAGARQ
jgi:hypothetical protein